ncbi:MULTISPECIES: redoxin family protein [unclassified Mucilaginibacter]|uniref:TlpA family protein disulfide reductase n=1 Tax=unclassified Mucilaginibacter TaxID=2617802 RepID=UPI002AC90A01|nr:MULTISPECIES: redoxin family protein [unclassified Mucilaginibacter]MEB0263065.1 redoxin family protein [Mucilaginibacter sp. 10I4]MEB0277524.1 redoxin family protein [Mucilaginibacter sp. 10B2]MEB0299439.1 redoxin family protein [Mucilaginibacter sp. 5C4]WPX24846.1 redoxin family protein [Mucilaginibacter sp. 5C4]
MKKSLSLILLFLLLDFFAVNAQVSGPKKSPITAIPDLELLDINGKLVKIKELTKGKVLFIDNWFIPCPPCFIEMKMLHNLHAKYAGNKHFCFITISRTDREIVKKFIAKDRSLKKYVDQYQFLSTLDSFKLPVYFLPGCDAKVEIAGKMVHGLQPSNPTKCADNILGFDGYPAVFIFDKQGKLIFNKVGYDGKDEANMAEIENIIKPALAAN